MLFIQPAQGYLNGSQTVGFFNGAPISRMQDNYVVQWGLAPLPDGEELPGHIARALPGEFEVSSSGMSFTPIPDGDVYAPEAGFVKGFPAGRDPASSTTWMAHCYGVVAVPRGNDPGSGSGAGLYVVTGHSPRHLDRNLSMVGRVLVGMQHLSSLPRGTGPLGRYESPEERTFITQVQLGSDLAPADRVGIEVLRTDSDSFRSVVLAARSRHEEFFVHPTDRIELCNVPVPTRPLAR